MTQHNLLKLLLLAAASLLMPVAFAQLPATPQWQIVAGGKMSFDVASIRLDTSGKFTPANLDMSAEDTYMPTGGLFSADFPLAMYITFAYKIWLTPNQQSALLAGLPKWVGTDKFAIQARASGNPTKDQMRLMMQSLLAERFHLAVHFETDERAVLALKLDKPGKLGLQLRPHAEGLPCEKTLPIPADRQGLTAEMLPCNSPMAVDLPDKEKFLGFRNSSINLFMHYLPLIGMGDRPVIDQTGLTGTFDIAINFARGLNGSELAAGTPQSDLPGPTLLEALKDQLGLKLEPTKAPLSILFVDHVDHPSEN